MAFGNRLKKAFGFGKDSKESESKYNPNNESIEEEMKIDKLKKNNPSSFKDEDEKDRATKTKDFLYLDNLIHSGQKEIVLSENISFKLHEIDFYEGGIHLDMDNLIIDGNGRTIDGANRSRIFIITGRNITLKNIIFKNGYVSKDYDAPLFNDGGSIFVQIGASLNLINCRFINNTVLWNGGAIVNYGHLSMKNNVFNDNIAGKNGGAIFNIGHLNISEDNFEGNRCEIGGAIYNRSHLEISGNVSYSNNNSDDDVSQPIFNNNLIEIDNVELDLDELVYNSNNGSVSTFRKVEDNIINEKQEEKCIYQDDIVQKEEAEIIMEDNVISKENVFSNGIRGKIETIELPSREVYATGWKYAIIFISSTFNDMHAERDYLIKEVFPELGEWCEKRKIRLIDVDLRWGVSEKDSKNNQTIEKCLRHIDKSRPFFVCFLGQRRGWIPEFPDDINENTVKRYPDICGLEGKSATEMEIEHALLHPLHMLLKDGERDCDASNSLFFFRDDSYLENLSPYQRKIYTNEAEADVELADRELEKIKEKVRHKQLEANGEININITDYEGVWDSELELPELSYFENGEDKGRLTDFRCSGKPLKEVLLEQLREQISLEFPENMEIKTLTEFEENLNREEIFCYLNSEGFIPRLEYSEKLKNYVIDSNEKVCLVLANAGYGKTMLLSNFALEFQSKYSNKKLYKRFCGASNFSLNAYSLWKSIIDEANINNEIVYPNNIDELKINFEHILNAISNKGDSVIVIDAINQMNDGVDMLRWLGKYKLPDNLKIIISIKKESIQSGITNDFHAFEIRGLDEIGKRKLINHYLSNYLKVLDENQIDVICNFEASKNPLFLKILLSELRVFGSFEQLNEKIEKFGNSPVSAFKHVLDRLASDEIKTDIVPLIFSLLANARIGLSEDELIDIIKSQRDLNEKIIRDSIRLNLRQIRQFMTKKDGCHDFFYDSFKIASREKYGDNNKLLLDYFKKKADPNHDYSFSNAEENNLRALNELPFHLNSAGDYKGLEKVLSSYSFIKNKLKLSNVYNLVADYHFDQNHEFYKVENHPIVLIGNALELSAPVLINHKDQLPAQIWGRLEGIENKIIKCLLDELIIKTDGLWLKSKGYSLYSPYSPIIKKLDSFAEKSVTNIVFFPDKKIIWGNDDGTLNLYDLNEDYYEKLSKKDSKIIKIFFGEDLDLFVGYSNGIIEKWDINRRMRMEFPKLEAEITDIYYSRTYGKLYFSSYDGIFSIDLDTYELRKEDIESKNYNQFLIPPILGHMIICDEKEVDGWDNYEMRSVYYKKFSVNDDSHVINTDDEIRFMACIDRFLILISYAGELKIWNMLKTSGGGEAIDVCHTVSSMDNFNKAVAFEDSRRIMILSQMGCLNFWDLPNPKNPVLKSASEQGINEIETGIFFPSAIAEYWCGEENWVVIGNENNNIYIVDLDKSYNYKKHNSAVISIIVHDEDVITCSDNGECYIWNFNDEKLKSEFSSNLRGSHVSYDSSDNRLVSSGIEIHNNGSIFNKICILDLIDGKIEDYMANNDTILDISQNNSNIIFIDKNKLIIGNDEIYLDKNATSLASDFNYNDVFVGFEDGSIIKYPNEFRFDKTIECSIAKMKIIDDTLVVGYENGAIEIFDLDGNHLNTLIGHIKRINDVFSFEKYLISASMDNTLRLWSIEVKSCVYTQFLDIPATSINVKDKKLVIGDSLGNVRFFDFENLN